MSANETSTCHNASITERDGKKFCDVCKNECTTGMPDETQTDAQPEVAPEAPEAAPSTDTTVPESAPAGEGEGQPEAPAPEGEGASAPAAEGGSDAAPTGDAPAA